MRQFGRRATGAAWAVSAPGMVDLIAGHYAFQMDTLGTSKGVIEGGKRHVLAIAAEKRLAQLPDAPTVQEGPVRSQGAGKATDI